MVKLLCISIIYVCLIPCLWSEHQPELEVHYGVNGDFRIIGGKPAKVGEFKGQVSLQNRFYAHICAGILIDPIHIITAAHCHQQQKRIVYVMGDDVSVAIKGAETRQLRKVKHFVQHPQFVTETFQNDIAVIRVDEPFNTTERFGPMIRSESTPKNNTKCNVVGWGYTTNDADANISYDLLKTDVNVIDINYCNSSSSYETLMKPGMLCAGRKHEGGHDACQGDSGGLLTCSTRNISNIVVKEISAIVSFGYECGLPEFPGIYSDVSFYNDWIDEIISTEELPEYEYSPFLSQNDDNNLIGKASNLTSSVLTFLLSLTIRSLWNEIYFK